jgi:3-(3-hydroxy-phenyl)propionate hydroxylase
MVDVALVGYGPIGATLANQLGQAGLSVAVFERETAIHPLPRAIHFDGEIMRVFQSIGLRQQVESIARPGTKGMHFVNAEGRTLLVRGGTALRGPHGCANNYYFHQPDLEVVLRAGVERFPKVARFEGCEVIGVEDAGDHVRLTLEDGTGAPPRTACARYVVGCDGGRSILRRVMQVQMEDLGLHQPWLVFDALLTRELPLPDYTVQHCDPARPMTACYVTGRRRRWEIMLMPGDDPQTIARPETVWPMLARWITPADATLERSVVYTFHSVIARGWRRGRLMIAGDAAHQTPPFLGQGLCAGVRDAANLAWKLDWVVRGRAPESLLDSYETERRPHVHAFIDLAVRLGEVIQATDPQAARARDARFLQGEAQIFEFPAPGLGPGVHAGTAAGGSIPPQFELDDGNLIDARIGDRFAVIGDAAVIGAVDDATRARWRQADAVILDAPGAAAGVWLAAQGAKVLVLRPDRYALGVAADAAGLQALTRLIPVG